MAYTGSDLSLANRHVEEGERHILTQELLISNLRLKGLPTDAAEALLLQFNSTLVQHRTHRDEIEAALCSRGSARPL